jgi:hypothetical protein
MRTPTNAAGWRTRASRRRETRRTVRACRCAFTEGIPQSPQSPQSEVPKRFRRAVGRRSRSPQCIASVGRLPARLRPPTRRSRVALPSWSGTAARSQKPRGAVKISLSTGERLLQDPEYRGLAEKASKQRSGWMLPCEAVSRTSSQRRTTKGIRTSHSAPTQPSFSSSPHSAARPSSRSLYPPADVRSCRSLAEARHALAFSSELPAAAARGSGCRSRHRATAAVPPVWRRRRRRPSSRAGRRRQRGTS